MDRESDISARSAGSGAGPGLSSSVTSGSGSQGPT
jgi:hypothetical protein